MIADPPVEAGAVQEITEEALTFAEALTAVGAAATVMGVTEFEATEADETPVPINVPVVGTLVAVTVKV